MGNNGRERERQRKIGEKVVSRGNMRARKSGDRERKSEKMAGGLDNAENWRGWRRCVIEEARVHE